MNKKKFLQTESGWGNLGYPYAPWYIRNCGCGEVSIANIIIELEKYAEYTPKTIQPYCKQFAAPNGDGTYFAGIPKMMEHYGLEDVKEHDTMASLWRELEKGSRVAIYLMGSRPGGSRGVHWTSGGHFVCSVGYKHEDGLHKVYVKDSYSSSPLRNGWISFEKNMKGDVVRVWSGKLPETIKPYKYKPTTPYDGRLPKGTVKYGSKGTDAKRLKAFLNWCCGTDFSGKGKCGNGTVKALKRWEKTYGLEPDGVWGEKCRDKANQIISKYAKPKKSKYYNETTIIGQACCDEDGDIKGGKAGDQTGGEVKLSPWSASYGWKYVIRLKDKSLRDKLAQAAIDACENKNIGYDTKKPDRYTAWDLAEKNGHNIKGINKKCETTCSQLVSMCLRAVGVSKKYAKRHFDIAAETKSLLHCPLFDVYKDKNHTQSAMYLQPGDIVLSSGHTAIVAKSPNAKVR